MKVLVLNGPNLSRLGQREPEIYGRHTLGHVEQLLLERGKALDCTIRLLQSNHEGQLIDWIETEGQETDAIIINPGALAHTSYALADALRGSGKPVVEVHVSNVHRRETFRQQLITGGAAVGVITGFGIRGYALALEYLAAPELNDARNSSKRATSP